MPYRTRLTREFIVEKTELNPITGCWIWQLAIDPRGYPILGRNPNGQRFGHRLAYELYVGRIPGDMTVDHMCFQTDCVNPQHLQLLPNAENAVRKEPAAAKAWRLAHQLPKVERPDECRKGHPWTPANTHIRPDGERRCRACARAAKVRAKAKSRAGT